MLNVCSSALLISTDEDLISRFTSLALTSDVKLRVESSYLQKYKIYEDVVICDSHLVQFIGDVYHNRTVVVLAENEEIVPYFDKFNFFLFNRRDVRQLKLAFTFIADVNLEKSQRLNTCEKIVIATGRHLFMKGDYKFDFANDKFYYKGKQIYLTVGQKFLLAQWLFLEKKTDCTRTTMCRLRKKFGKEFLSDITIHGEMK